MSGFFRTLRIKIMKCFGYLSSFNQMNFNGIMYDDDVEIFLLMFSENNFCFFDV